MKAKIRVTFDMEFDGGVECKATSSFTMIDPVNAPIPEGIELVLMQEIGLLCEVYCATEGRPG